LSGERSVGAGRNRGLLLALSGIGVLFLITALAYRLPAPRSDAAPDVFSAPRARAQLQSLLAGGVAHPLGSAANARLGDMILARLAELGYDTEVQSGFVCNEYAVCGTPRNIIARLRTNRPTAGSAVLLAAHYDSVPAGPGASDDLAGVATILEIARILHARPPTRHPILLLISDGEEPGLLGASLFVNDHPLARHVFAAVNLEARGSSGPSLMFETGSANAWLMSLYGRTVARPITDSMYHVAYQALRNDTDFSVFKAAGWQGFNFAYIGNVGHYHTPLDNEANADVRSIQHQGDNALASLLALADSDVRSASQGDAVYFDVLSHLLIKWPGSASLPAAAAISVFLLIEAAMLWRRRRLTFRQFAWGCGGCIVCLLVAGVASIGILAALCALGKVPPLRQYSWIAHPEWMYVASAALAAGAAGLSSIWLGKRANFWGFWTGAVLLTALCAITEAFFSPGMGFLPLLTAGSAGIAVLPSLRAPVAAGPASVWPADMAAIVPAWVLFALVIPVVALLYAGIGSIAWPLDTLQFGFGAILLLPLLAAATARLRRGIVVLSAALTAACVILTLLLPTYSAAWPQRLNFAYVADEDTHSAFWVAQPDSLQLPAAVAHAARFEKITRPVFPGSRARGFHAAASWQDLPAPQLTLRAASAQSAGVTRYLVHLQSMRAAPEIEAAFAGAADIHEIILSGGSAERRIPLFTAHDGTNRLHVVGLGPEGLDFAVDVRGGSLEAHLWDQSFTLVGGEFLQRLRSREATSSQDGDTTVVQSTVLLAPAAGR
jgi:hypothetical protein